VQPYNLAADAALQQAVTQVHTRRCATCHQPADVSRLDWVDIRQPARTLFLVAPLAKDAGGTGKCGAVYPGTEDADYQVLLQRVSAAVREAWSRPRRDVVTLPRTEAFVSR
jgi:hypothetical protein